MPGLLSKVHETAETTPMSLTIRLVQLETCALVHCRAAAVDIGSAFPFVSP